MQKRNMIIMLGSLLLVCLATIWLVRSYHGPVEPLRKDMEAIRQKHLNNMFRQAEGRLMARRYQETARLVRRIRSIDPENSHAIELQGRLEYARGNYFEAMRIYRTLLLLYPDNPLMRNNFGQSMIRMGNVQGGLVQLLRAHDLDPESVWVKRNIENAYLLLGDEENARKYHTELSILVPRAAAGGVQ